MTSETFIVRDEKGCDALTAYIKNHLDFAPFEVVIHIGGRNRSVEQNRLLWLWNTEIGNYMGLTKDDVHELLKRKFAVPIFERDNPDYGEMIATIKKLQKENIIEEKTLEHLKTEIVRLTSTSDFSIDQMSEYLLDIEHYAAEIGAELTFPEELYGGEKKVKEKI